MADNYEGNIFNTPEEANAWIQMVMNRATARPEASVGEAMADGDLFIRGIRERLKGLQAQDAIHRARAGQGEVLIPSRGPAN